MDYDMAASFWERKTSEFPMEESELRGAVDAFIGRHKICALATGYGDFVRNTPIEYNYTGGKFWFFSEGGLKFKALKDNKNVCLAIYEADLSTFVASLPENAPPPCLAYPPYVSTIIFLPVSPLSPKGPPITNLPVGFI